MPTAVGYIRRSTEMQEESLHQQKAKLSEFAKAKGWDLVAIFEDNAISGSNLDRPGLNSLFKRIESDNGIDVVLAWERNRFARPKDPIDGLNLERRIFKLGKRVVYAATGQEADRSLSSSLMGLIEHHQNGDYLRKLSRDTMRGLTQRAQRGLWSGGPIPFGYDRLILDADGKPRRIVRTSSDERQSVLDPVTGKCLELMPIGRKYGKQDFETCSLIPSEDVRVRAVQK